MQCFTKGFDVCLTLVDLCVSLSFSGENRRVVNFQVIPSVSFKFINTLRFSNKTSDVVTACFLLKALLLYTHVFNF